MSKQEVPPKENGLLNLVFNIVLPVLILNKLSKFIGPPAALVLALAFPLGYGIYDLVKRKKVNAFSALGLLNVLFTGGLALLGLHGFWFAVKEAAFPTLVGLFVLGSAFTRRPFIETLFLNPAIMKVELLEQRLQEHGKQKEFHAHMKSATVWLSLSFAFSAVCNFILARRIFINIDPALSSEAQSVILNEQIAQMTTWSMAVIMVPSILFLLGIFWYLMRGIKQHAGLSTEELLREN
ncbi:VC0807 family protein [Bdellovibrio sp.]|uniref:VC0807 family protein n=1 Tax=Bdellovibrio sp. TaxID=28201 RepID=UPI0039E46D9C